MLIYRKYNNHLILNSPNLLNDNFNFFLFEFKKNNKVSRKLCLIILIYFYLDFNNILINKNNLLLYLIFYFNSLNLIFYKTFKFCLF